MVSLMQLGPAARAQAVKQIGEQGAVKPKYGNKRVKFKSVQGFTVTADSQLEKGLFEWLDQEMVAGRVKWWLPHPRFPLPGKRVSYSADALAVHTYTLEGPGVPMERIAVYDAKGMDTQSSIRGRKQVADLFGVEVELVKR